MSLPPLRRQGSLPRTPHGGGGGGGGGKLASTLPSSSWASGSARARDQSRRRRRPSSEAAARRRPSQDHGAPSWPQYAGGDADPGSPALSSSASSSWLQRSWKKQASVMLWTGEQEAQESTPSKGHRAAVEKIELGESGGAATPKWSRPTSREAREAPVRSCSRVKRPFLPEHLGERVRRFRSEWRPTALEEVFKRKHDINVRREKARLEGDAEEESSARAERRRLRDERSERSRARRRQREEHAKLREQQTEEGEPRTKGRERGKKKKGQKKGKPRRKERGEAGSRAHGRRRMAAAEV